MEAKRKCRLNTETVRMAKELGLNPRSLVKNIPSKAQPWKAPVHVWIREMYEKRRGKAAAKQLGSSDGAPSRNEKPPVKAAPGDLGDYDPEPSYVSEADEVPF